MITFQRRRLRSWLESTPDYVDYNHSPQLLYFENEEECKKWIIENYDISYEFFDLQISTSDDIPDGKNRRSVVFGGVIGWIEDVIS